MGHTIFQRGFIFPQPDFAVGLTPFERPRLGAMNAPPSDSALPTRGQLPTAMDLYRQQAQESGEQACQVQPRAVIFAASLTTDGYSPASRGGPSPEMSVAGDTRDDTPPELSVVLESLHRELSAQLPEALRPSFDGELWPAIEDAARRMDHSEIADRLSRFGRRCLLYSDALRCAYACFTQGAKSYARSGDTVRQIEQWLWAANAIDSIPLERPDNDASDNCMTHATDAARTLFPFADDVLLAAHVEVLKSSLMLDFYDEERPQEGDGRSPIFHNCPLMLLAMGEDNLFEGDVLHSAFQRPPESTPERQGFRDEIYRRFLICGARCQMYSGCEMKDKQDHKRAAYAFEEAQQFYQALGDPDRVEVAKRLYLQEMSAALLLLEPGELVEMYAEYQRTMKVAAELGDEVTLVRLKPIWEKIDFKCYSEPLKSEFHAAAGRKFSLAVSMLSYDPQRKNFSSALTRPLMNLLDAADVFYRLAQDSLSLIVVELLQVAVWKDLKQEDASPKLPDFSQCLRLIMADCYKKGVKRHLLPTAIERLMECFDDIVAGSDLLRTAMEVRHVQDIRLGLQRFLARAELSGLTIQWRDTVPSELHDLSDE